MNVIAKMECSSVEDYGFSREIKFRCVHDNGLNVGDNPENRSFTKATPNGSAKMTIDNKHVWGAFRLAGGEAENYRRASEHYVVFIDAEEHNLDDVHRALAALNSKE